MNILHLLQTVGSLWIVVGLYIDGWAHENLPSTLETFFTPWHAILYSGLLFSIVILVGYYIKHKNSEPITNYLKLPLTGGLIFMFGGLADLIWHTTLGIEKNIEALYSPPHLVLAIGGFILVSSIVRKWFENHLFKKAEEWLPIFISLALSILLILFFISYTLPINHPQFEIGPFRNSVGSAIVGSIVQHIIMTGALLMMMAKRKLPIGSSSVIIVSLAFLTLSHYTFHLIPALIVTAIVAELFLALTKRNIHNFRIFAFLLPAITQSSLIIYGSINSGLQWSTTLLLGNIIVSGIAGLLISILVQPPHRELE